MVVLIRDIPDSQENEFFHSRFYSNLRTFETKVGNYISGIHTVIYEEKSRNEMTLNVVLGLFDIVATFLET